MIRYVLLLLAAPAHAEGLDIRLQDGNPLDRFVIFNRDCPLIDATFTLDFTTSAGAVVIDTEYGGLGTRDPSDVRVLEGDAILRPVADGDRVLRIDVATLPTLAPITVTLDVDDTVAAFEGDRVSANGAELSGATVQLDINGQTATTTLDDTGRATLSVPPAANACALS